MRQSENDAVEILPLSNLAAAIQFDLRDEIHSLHNSPDKKYLYQLNVNLSISELKFHLIALLLTDSPLQCHPLLHSKKALQDCCAHPT